MSELPADTRLGAIRLRAGDAGLLRDFYERAIGLRGLATGNGVIALGAGGVPLVELVSAPEAPARPPATTGLFHLALLVPTRADLSRALRRVFEAGWHLSGASDHLVSEALYLSDPEGNGIELYRDRPREEWPRQGDEVAMATLPLDLESLLAEPGGDADAPSIRRVSKNTAFRWRSPSLPSSRSRSRACPCTRLAMVVSPTGPWYTA